MRGGNRGAKLKENDAKLKENEREAEMAKGKTAVGAQAGDLVVIDGHRVGEGRRIGEILDVVRGEGSEHYRVLWEDGHESVLYPSSDVSVKHKATTPA